MDIKELLKCMDKESRKTPLIDSENKIFRYMDKHDEDESVYGRVKREEKEKEEKEIQELEQEIKRMDREVKKANGHRDCQGISF